MTTIAPTIEAKWKVILLQRGPSKHLHGRPSNRYTITNCTDALTEGTPAVGTLGDLVEAHNLTVDALLEAREEIARLRSSP